MKELITDIPIVDMPKVAAGLGLKAYAADQIIRWLYQRRASSFAEMTNLSVEVRDALAEKFNIDALAIADCLEASDGTKKFLCRARDGECVECVLIPADDKRWTVCISTQVGCRMGCSFCRTARMGLKRNLSMGEILGQLLLVMRGTEQAITNVVLMGMGEPLDNFDAVADAVEAITDKRALGMSKRRVTLSTVGLIPELTEFSKRFDVKIAISLNATTDEIRSRIMPINKKYPIAMIMEFCRDYSKRFRNRITFEYVMIAGVNDSKDDASRLVSFLKGVRAKINLIPHNAFEGSDLKPSDDDTIQWWSEFLYNKGIQTNIRASRGQEIMAACGQLATIKK